MLPRFLPLAVLAPAVASAFTIQLDYSYDSGTFLSGNATARAALAAAASDLSALLTDPLQPIASDMFTGVNGATTLTVDWRLQFANPSTGVATTLESFSLPADTFRVFVGSRALEGNTLGVGGHVGAGIGLQADGFQNQLAGAIDHAETSSDSAMTRGLANPKFGTLGGTFSGEPFSFSIGPVAGALSFNSGANWHYDHTTAVGAGKADFYSVALHEILHTLGIGTSVTWTNLVSGTTWLGAQAAALNGTGAGLIDAGGAHIADGIQSTSFAGGVVQEAAMDPTIFLGTRKVITQLDVAFLRDIGYQTLSAVPEPAAYASLAGLGVLAVAVRRRRDRR